jgi:hypothetical protein
MNELVKLENPKFPMYWEYETSTKFVSETIFKWKNLTGDVAKELWIARIMLSKEGRPKTGSKDPVKTWAQYCEEIGSSKGIFTNFVLIKGSVYGISSSGIIKCLNPYFSSSKKQEIFKNES